MRSVGRRGFAAAAGMAVLLAVYLALAVGRAVAFLAAGSAIGIAFGVALLLLPLLGGFLVGRELWFGLRAERLLRRFVADGGVMPGVGLATRPSGRVERSAADAVFRDAADEVESHPDDWRSWLRAGLAYDLCGDRRRARGAVRRAIALEQRVRSA